jgi:hypothetical protein
VVSGRPLLLAEGAAVEVARRQVDAEHEGHQDVFCLIRDLP